MDYALLAATALGAIGLYLMMPRERAPLARLGGLLSAMALAGFFLYLVRAAHGGVPRVGAGGASATGGVPVYFYLFAAIMIAGSVGVICQPKPVYAALYFVLVTLAGAGIFVLLLAEFMAIVLIIIYAGAILVTYVFVIMLASQGSASAAVPLYDRRAAEPFASVFVAFVLLGTILQVIFPANGRVIAEASGRPDTLMAASLGIGPNGEDLGPTAAPAMSNVQVLGADLYSHYALSLELAGVLLTIALVGAVVIARKNQAIDILGTGQLPVE